MGNCNYLCKISAGDPAFLLKNELDDFTYNKAIQKMLESYRVSAEDKEMLRGIKRKATGRKNAAKPGR